MYDAGNKRFMSVDPIKGKVVDPMTLVPYTYVLNNPMAYVDPLGMWPKWLDFKNLKNGATDVVKKIERGALGYFKEIKSGFSDPDYLRKSFEQALKGGFAVTVKPLLPSNVV